MIEVRLTKLIVPEQPGAGRYSVLPRWSLTENVVAGSE